MPSAAASFGLPLLRLWLGMVATPKAADSQAAVFRLLGDSATYGGDEVRRCETHAAIVFLAGDRAIKVKRAVRYPFLDYSTLDKRQAACRAELDINRKFAPQLYRRVIPITRQADGSLALDGPGEAVEWAVEMQRFDENQTLDHLADRSALDDVLTGKLAIAVAAMHGRAEPVEAAPWLAAVEAFIADNTAAFRQHADLFPARMAEEIDRASKAAFARWRPLLAARGAAGLIRRGHGDLHLGNIAVLDGEPVAFDAIEFDPIIAEGDLLYDLAFLLMDLLERGLKPEANAVLNGYFATSRRIEDCDGIAALPFFMSLRAAIRAKVTAARRDLAAPEERTALAQSAKRYFDLALALLAPTKPMIVCTGGLSGTGKSVLARMLAPLLPPSPGALVLRSDVERKQAHAVPEHERLPPEAYSAAATERIYRGLIDKAARVARAGYSVIVDAVFAQEWERDAVETAAAAAQVDMHGLFLVADLPTRLHRVTSRGPDASDADDAIARQQQKFDLRALTWSKIDASGSQEATLAKAREAIAIPKRG
ncbi:MAG TPA: AAA family ATPase [Xanthobacteraceae bacterium]|nr:AAA family ATPase [Xanthobacteraceae bacterium]